MDAQQASAEERKQAELQADAAVRAAKLALVDSLLWDTDFLREYTSASPTGRALLACDLAYACDPVRSLSCWPPAGGTYYGTALAGMLHRALVLGMRCLEVSISDVSLTVSQQDAPGPYTGLGGALEGRDSLRLYVRQLLLMPEAPAGPCCPSVNTCLWRSLTGA